MDKENCIYVDANGKWWTAEANVFGEGKITLIEEKNKCEIKEEFDSEFIAFVNAVAPQILYVQDGSWQAIDAEGRKVVHQE